MLEIHFTNWFSNRNIYKITGDVSHILNNYLEHDKSIKLKNFVKVFVGPDDYVGSLATNEINVSLLEPHSP